jgi:hypothetical protein
MKNVKLLTTICGFERGGTTVLSDILRQHPKIYAGFEGGILLAQDPFDFKTINPYYENFKRGWKLSDDQMDMILSAPNWQQIYARIAQESEIIRPHINYIFDKTPIYIKYLSSVMSRVPNTPCLVISRDPRSVIASWLKRRENLDIQVATKRYLSYVEGYQMAISNGFGDNILKLRYEDLCTSPKLITKKVFNFLKIPFKPSYLSLNFKNANVHDSTVVKKYMYEYQNILTPSQEFEILKLTQHLKDWVYFE